MSVFIYYIDQYLDEVMPCDGSLEGWAKWLSTPDVDWGRTSAAADGEQFRASVLRFEDDVIASLEAGGWVFSDEPANADLIAIRFGPGTGWDADYIFETFADLRVHLEDPDNADILDDVEFIAVGFEAPPVMLTYRADPPRLHVEQIQ